MTEAEAKLIRMATEIHQFFRLRGPDAAAAAAADHLRQFWPRQMRQEFLDLVARSGETIPIEARNMAEKLGD